jgi:hypothetical protein
MKNKIKFNVGDKIRIVSVRNPPHQFYAVGDVGVIDKSDYGPRITQHHINFNGFDNKVVFKDGFWWVFEDEIELVLTPEEVVKAYKHKKKPVRQSKEEAELVSLMFG